MIAFRVRLARSYNPVAGSRILWQITHPPVPGWYGPVEKMQAEREAGPVVEGWWYERIESMEPRGAQGVSPSTAVRAALAAGQEPSE